MADDEIDLIWLGQNDEEDGGATHGASLILMSGDYLLLQTGDTILLEG